VPGKRQAFVELACEFVDKQAKDIFQGDRKFIAPAALTVFVWVLLMNSMDFLPVDVMAWFTHFFAPHGFRIVPTADVNTTFALALSVWLLMIYFSIAVKGMGGWIHELFCSLSDKTAVGRAAPWLLQSPVQPGRIHFQAAVALAAAVRQHVRGRDHLLLCGCWRAPDSRAPRRHPARRGLGDLPHPDRGAPGVHLHDAHDRLYLDGT